MSKVNKDRLESNKIEGFTYSNLKAYDTENNEYCIASYYSFDLDDNYVKKFVLCKNNEVFYVCLPAINERKIDVEDKAYEFFHAVAEKYNWCNWTEVS